MTRQAIIWTTAIAAVALIALAGAGLLVTSSLRDDISGKSVEVTRLQATVKQQTAQLATLESQLSGLRSKLHPGLANDVITCGDLQNMGLTWDTGVTVDNQGNVNLDTQPIPLPQHCVKS